MTIITFGLLLAAVSPQPVISLIEEKDVGEREFGDDSSDFANDGECDDPRFYGAAMAAPPLFGADIGRDASDCRRGIENKSLRWGDTIDPGVAGAMRKVVGAAGRGGYFFGSDESPYAKDGQCDDMRFDGPGAATILLNEDIGRDASDCAAAFAAGSISHRVLGTAPFDPRPEAARIDFGDDEGGFSDNGKCDDARFTGLAMNPPLLQADIGHDASDCRRLYQAGRIELQ